MADAVIVPHRMTWSWYTGRWLVGCYIWYILARSGPSSLAVPNVTTHPSTASVLITVLLLVGCCSVVLMCPWRVNSGITNSTTVKCLCVRQTWLAGRDIMFPTWSFVRLSVTKLVNTMFWQRKNRTDCVLIGTSGTQGKGMKRSTLVNFRSEGHSSRSYEVEDRFGGPAEASFSILSGRVGFLGFL